MDLSTLSAFVQRFHALSLPVGPALDELLAAARGQRSWSLNVLTHTAAALHTVGGARSVQDALDAVRDVAELWP